ncbi:MAG TPA: hypothetical protein VG889_04835 [Rhizomicrobium sp.]|nr:hypothetical protein [Rhizomicrobium sp.]
MNALVRLFSSAVLVAMPLANSASMAGPIDQITQQDPIAWSYSHRCMPNFKARGDSVTHVLNDAYSCELPMTCNAPFHLTGVKVQGGRIVSYDCTRKLMELPVHRTDCAKGFDFAGIWPDAYGCRRSGDEPHALACSHQWLPSAESYYRPLTPPGAEQNPNFDLQPTQVSYRCEPDRHRFENPPPYKPH